MDDVSEDEESVDEETMDEESVDEESDITPEEYPTEYACMYKVRSVVDVFIPDFKEKSGD